MYLRINEFKPRDFCGSNALWNYMVVNAPVEVLHNLLPKYQPKRGGDLG